jgi:MFS family permease
MNGQSLALNQAIPLLRNRPFRRLWFAQFCAIAAIYGLTLAGTILVERRTHSSAQTGLVLVSAILPAFLASLIAGAVVDRRGRRPVLVASHMARALVALAFWGATRYLAPGLGLTAVYVANVAGAIFSQFAMPAELAMLPDLVDHKRLMSANALLQLSMLVAEGLGVIALTPLITKMAGAPAVGLVAGGLCLVAMVLAATLPEDQPSPAQTEPETKESTWTALRADLQAGWQTIAQDRILSLVAIQATLAAALLLVLLSLVPGLASRHLGLNVEDAPLLALPGGLGFVLGAVLMSRWEARQSRLGWIALGLTGLGLSIGLMSILGSQPGRVWLLLPSILGLGLTLALVIVPARTVLQERPPAPLRGRVIAAQLALANAAAVLPLLLGGTLADHLGIRPVMGLLALLALGAGAISLHQARAWDALPGEKP